MFTAICLIFIAATMFYRANDIRRKAGWVWHVRKLGLVLTGTSAISMLLYDWMLKLRDLSVSETGLLFGVCLVFFTSPHLPPYWKWFFGYADAKDGTA